MKARIYQCGTVSLLLLALPFAVVLGQPTTTPPTAQALPPAAAVSQGSIQVLPTADLATKRDVDALRDSVAKMTADLATKRDVDALRDSVAKMTAAVDKLAEKGPGLVTPIIGFLG